MWGDGGGAAPELSEEEVRGGILKNRLAEELKTGQMEFISIIEKLGPTLTSTVPDVRARGVQLLSDILAVLPEDFLVESQLTFVSAFYVDRLKDNHRVIPPILEGLLSLLNMKHLPRDCPVKISKAIFEHVPCQQQVRNDRHHLYSILYKIVTNYLQEIKSIELDFVLGLILSMDGERDPRNLLFLFSILPTFLKSLNLGHVTEEMFEVMACYFPVDFNTPQDDVNSITRNDLAEKLSVCLCIEPTFDEFCLPLLLEKLNSNLKVAKIDSLKLLKQSCSSFSAKSFESHLHEIWQALQKEITQESDSELKIHALEAISELINKLCSDINNPAIAESFHQQILITMQSLLIDAKIKSRFEVPLQVFLKVSQASEKSCLFVVKNMNSQLVAYFRTVQEDILKIVVLNYFIELFKICKQWGMLHSVLDEFKFLVEIFLLTNNSVNTDLKISGYSMLCEFSELLSENESIMFHDIINYNINNEQCIQIVKASKHCLLSLAKYHPLCYEQLVDELLLFNAVIANSDLLRRRVDALCYLASLDYFTDKIIIGLLAFLKENGTETALTIIEVATNSFMIEELFREEKIQDIQKKHIFLHNILEWIMEKQLYTLENAHNIISGIIIVIVKAQTTLVQNELYTDILKKYHDIYLENDQSLVVLEALLNSSKRDAIIPNVGAFIQRAYMIAIAQSNYLQYKGCILIANIFNKYLLNVDVQNKYNFIKNELCNNAENTVTTNGIVVTSWITKALLQNGHRDATYWFSKMVEFTNSEMWGLQAAKGIALIMDNDEAALSKRCNCQVNFLYKQKVFQLFLQLNNNVGKCSISLLESWSYILQSIPKSVLIMELPKISDIIVECLNLESAEVLLVILDVFSYLIQNKKSVCALQTLLPRCMLLCNRTYPVKVRVASLQCIFDIANNCATYQLLVHKQDTTIELAKFLDDPKRVVRTIAVKARTRWFLVGAPGEEKEQ